MTNFHIFIVPLHLDVTLFSKGSCWIAHIKISYETVSIGRFSGKNPEIYQGPSQRLRWSYLWDQLLAFSR